MAILLDENETEVVEDARHARMLVQLLELCESAAECFLGRRMLAARSQQRAQVVLDLREELLVVGSRGRATAFGIVALSRAPFSPLEGDRAEAVVGSTDPGLVPELDRRLATRFESALGRGPLGQRLVNDGGAPKRIGANTQPGRMTEGPLRGLRVPRERLVETLLLGSGLGPRDRLAGGPDGLGVSSRPTLAQRQF